MIVIAAFAAGTSFVERAQKELAPSGAIRIFLSQYVVSIDEFHEGAVSCALADLSAPKMWCFEHCKKIKPSTKPRGRTSAWLCFGALKKCFNFECAKYHSSRRVMKVSHALETTHVTFVQLRSRKVAAIDIHGFGISANDLWEVAKGWWLGPWLSYVHSL